MRRSSREVAAEMGGEGRSRRSSERRGMSRRERDGERVDGGRYSGGVAIEL